MRNSEKVSESVNPKIWLGRKTDSCSSHETEYAGEMQGGQKMGYFKLICHWEWQGLSFDHENKWLEAGVKES